MTNRAFSVMTMLSVALLAVILFGCAKRPLLGGASAPAPTVMVVPSPSPEPSAAPAAPRASKEPSAAVATPEPMTPVVPAWPAPREFVSVADLRDIRFDFDRDEIRPDDAKALDANAQWLKANVDRSLLIEGHCDERGTIEYNLALGDRRAQATKNYLVAQGVRESRITVISYGKERPICAEHDEACWTENRRAHLVVNSR